MKIIYQDQTHEFQDGMNALDMLKQLDAQLYKEAVAVRVNGQVRSLPEAVPDGAQLEFLTFADPDGQRVLRHTASHVLAQAVKRLFPQAKLAIGPAIDNGFYYDFDVDEPFTPEFLKDVEKIMKAFFL